MGYKEFFPFGTKSIEIIFNCSECAEEITSEEHSIPQPNYLAEKASDSHNSITVNEYCESCSAEYEININVGYGDAYVEIYDIEDNDILEIIGHQDEYDEEYYNDQIDSILSTTNYYDIFLNEIENLKSLNDIDLRNNNLQKTLLRQLYSSIISCLEDYLSSTLVFEVFNSEDNFKNFVKTNPKIKDRKFSLNEIYDELGKIEDIVKKELLEVIYHDLPKVKNMYQDSLKIKFPEIGDLMLIIKTRHDMVHRNGKNKEGKIIEINEGIIDDVIIKVSEFILEIESKIRPEEKMKGVIN